MSILDVKAHLRSALNRVLKELDLPIEEIEIEPSTSPEFGDLSTNIALVLSRGGGMNRKPLDLAGEIESRLKVSPDFCQSVSVSQPGFINFTINPAYLVNQIPVILKAGDTYGRSKTGEGKNALVEFVSANPTGPLTVGHGRQAVLGDMVSNILQWHGFDVTREYYFNDAGRQMRLLAESVYARYRELLGEKAQLPEGGYEGDYIRDIARVIKEDNGDTLKDRPDSPLFKETAVRLIFSSIKDTLQEIGITFDSFVNELTFYEDGSIDRVIKGLRRQDLAYDKDGAVWFRSTRLGKSQDTVLLKSSGEPTYRLPDIAYHQHKIDRGFDLIVDLFGADHKDTYPDVLAAVETLGYPTENIRVLLHQFVTLKEKGQKVRMSTRKAAFVTLNELIHRVGPDVVRYFFIMRGRQSHLNFDLDLAAKESDENPVYYLQYAHARIANIKKYGRDMRITLEGEEDLSLIREESELTLLKHLIRFPGVTQTALDTLEPQGIANFLQDVATHFHKFYTEHRVVTDDIPVSRARLALVSATRVVLANGLQILGITAPERM
ncbi:MAG: arginine--tRNA ligase [Fidelibacterota bacterium]